MDTSGLRQSGRTYRILEKMLKESIRDDVKITYFILSHSQMRVYAQDMFIKLVEGIKDPGLNISVKENSIKINQYMFVFSTYLNPGLILGMDRQPMLIGSRAKVYLDHTVEHSDIRDK